MAVVRVAVVCVAVLASVFMQSRGCGYTPDDPGGEGEPCTRSSECQSHLECRGGVCRVPGGFDAGGDGFDAGPDPVDAGDEDAATSLDAGDLDAGDLDAGDLDGGDLDAGDLDGGDLDAGDVDAGDPDAGDAAAPLDGGSDAS